MNVCVVEVSEEGATVRMPADLEADCYEYVAAVVFRACVQKGASPSSILARVARTSQVFLAERCSEPFIVTGGE